ncbi:MAG: hypothetical protein QOH68_2066 [Nocardioidaceae bacterium]|nr:hypothetical protein [Nocardioidaceae bacterium]
MSGAETSSATLVSRALVGRERELASLQEAWRQGGTARVVSSAAGVGKSRLLRELSSLALSGGGLVLTGRCSPTGQNLSLRPWREALLAAARAGRRPPPALDAFVPTLARLVPEWGEASVDASPLVLGDAVLRLLTSWTPAGTASVLALEDIQWADPDSLAVLEYVVDNLSGVPVLVIATLREGEPGSGADLVSELISRRAAALIHLQPLSNDEVLRVAHSCLGDEELPGDAARALIDRCDGVPFLVEELLATAVTSGWDTIGTDVPGSVATSVATRLEGLPAHARALLSTAALLGRHFDWTVAANAAGVREDEAPDLLRLAVRAQLVDVEGAGFRFRHALTRDAVAAQSLPAEQVALASRILDTLTVIDPDLSGERCALAADLARIAGDTDVAIELWLRAAARALDEGSLASAEALATRARELSEEPSTAADRFLLRVYALSGQTERAATIGKQLLALSSDPNDRAEIHLVLGSGDLAAGRWDDADEHAVNARTLTPDDAGRLARADALAALAAMGRYEVDTAVTLAHAALEGARLTGQPSVECEALEVIGRAERGRDIAAAEAAFTKAHDIAKAAGLGLWEVRAMQELGTVDLFHSLAPDRLLAARSTALRLGALAAVAVIDLQLSALYDERGDLLEALAAARRCEEASRRWRLSTLPMSLAMQAAVHARAGDRAAMEAAIDAALATGEDRQYVEVGAFGNARAVLHVITGDLRAGAEAGDQAMAVLRNHPGAVHPSQGLWALLRTLVDGLGGRAARAEVAALAVDTPVSRETLWAAEAVALGQAGDRESAEARFAEADTALASHQGGFRQSLTRLLVAPAAHADAWGEPIAWLRESLANFEGKGLDALAARCRSVLRELGAPVPRRGRGELATVPPALAALGITSREVDVLALVATGASNRQVGEQLFISTRTVDKHVERLLQKAATTRAGLTDLAREAGLLRT